MRPFDAATQEQIEAACRLAGWDPARTRKLRVVPRRDVVAELVREVERSIPTPLIPPALNGIAHLGYAKVK